MARASSRFCPHIEARGRRLAQIAGRSGFPNSPQRKSPKSWTQRTPAGLPSGMPGIGEEMLRAMQHAPQVGRQSMAIMFAG